MRIKIIFKDKTAGCINEVNLARLLRKGAIVAFNRAGGWVYPEEGRPCVRRTRKKAGLPESEGGMTAVRGG